MNEAAWGASAHGEPPSEGQDPCSHADAWPGHEKFALLPVETHLGWAAW